MYTKVWSTWFNLCKKKKKKKKNRYRKKKTKYRKNFFFFLSYDIITTLKMLHILLARKKALHVSFFHKFAYF
jgi:hypothetical protein